MGSTDRRLCHSVPALLLAGALLSLSVFLGGCLQDMDPSPAIDASTASDAGATGDAGLPDAAIVDAAPPPDADGDAGMDAGADAGVDAMPDADITAM
jgi:hypothetical protein